MAEEPHDNRATTEYLTQLYNSRPDLFTLEDTDLLQKNADELGIPFVRNGDQDELHLADIPKQLLGGFIQGVTGFIDPFAAPVNTTGEIAHELGALSGFVGSIFGLEGLGSVGSRFAQASTAAGQALVKGGGVTRTAEALLGLSRTENFSQALFKLGQATKDFRSVPLLGADLMMKYAGGKEAAEFVAKYFGGSLATEATLKQAFHLGAASSVPGLLHLNLKDALIGGVQGAFTGGVFSGVGALPIMGESTTMNRLIKTIAGGVAQGIPATMTDAPTAIQIKDYLLGGIFGWRSMTPEHYLANERLESLYEEQRGSTLGMETHPSYVDARPELQKAMREMNEKFYKRQQVGSALYEFFTDFLGMKDVGEEIKKDMPAPDEAPPDTPAAPNPGVDNVVKGQVEDFDPVVLPLTSRLRRAVSNLVGNKKLTDQEYAAHVNNLAKRVESIMREGGDWTDIQAHMKKIAGETAVTDESMASLKQFYISTAAEVPYAQGNINADTEMVRVYVPDKKGNLYSHDNLRLQGKRSANMFDALYNAPSLFTTINQIVWRGQAYDISQVNIVDMLPEGEIKKPTVTWTTLFRAARDHGGYLMVNNGDKPQFKIAKLHPRLNAKERTRITKAINKDKDLFNAAKTSFEFDVKEKKIFLNQREWEDAFYSNILYAEDYTGKKFNERGGEGSQFIRQVLEHNKRQQPLFSDYSPGRADASPIDGIKVVITPDFYKTKFWREASTEEKKKIFKENSDGSWTLRSDKFDQMAAAFGLPKGIDAIKPFSVSRNKKLGTLILKMAIHRASPEMDAMMHEAKMESFIVETGVKQRGRHEVSDYTLTEDGKFDFGENGMKEYHIPIEDIRMSFGTMDNAPDKINAGTTLAKQIMDSLTAEQTSPAVRQAFAKWVLDLVQGTDEANTALKTYLINPSKENLNKLIRYNAAGELDKESLFHDIGLQDLVAAMRNPNNKEFRELARTIIIRSGDPNLEDDAIHFQDDGTDLHKVHEELTDAMRSLHESDGSDAIAMSKPVKKMMDSMMTSFFVKRLSSPKVRSAGKAVLSPWTPDMWRRKDRELLSGDEVEGQYGNFYLGDAFKALRIIGIDRDGQKRWMTLGEQYEDMLHIQEIVVKAGRGKANQETIDRLMKKTGKSRADVEKFLAEEAAKKVPIEETPEVLAARKASADRQSIFEKRYAEMKKKLRAVVLRVPMDNIAGMQSLEFAGFTGTPGGRMIIHGKNMQRLGGADLDIDTAFFYFGMPEEMHAELYKNRNTPESRNGEDAMQILKREADLPLLRHPMGMYDPYHRMKIGYEVAKGRNLNLGVAVANKATIGFLYSAMDAQKDKEGYYRSGSVKFKPRADKGELLRTMAAAGVKMSADVGSEGGMVSPAELRAYLVHSAFEDIKVLDKFGKWKSVSEGSFIDLKEKTSSITKEMMNFTNKDLWQVPEYAALYDVNNKIWGYNYGEGRKWSHDEVVYAAQEFLGTGAGNVLLKDHPRLSVIRQIAGLEYRDSYLIRFNTRMDFLAKSLRRVEDLLNIENGKIAKELFPFLSEKEGEQPGINVEMLRKRVEAIQGTGFDLTSTEGMQSLSKSPEAYKKFVDGILDAAPKKSRDKLLKKAYPPEEAPYAGQEYALRFIRGQVEFADHMMGSRLKDMSSLSGVEILFQRSRLSSEEARGILRVIGNIKKDLDPKKNIPFNEISDRIHDAREAAYKLGADRGDSEAVTDFFDGALHSSLTADAATQYYTKQNNLVPEHILHFMQKQYTSLFNVMSAKGAAIDAAREFLINGKKVDAAIGNAFVGESGFVIHETIKFRPEQKVKATDKEVRELVRGIADRLNYYDGVTGEDVIGFFRYVTGKAQISDMDVYDLRGIYNILRKFRTETGVIKEFFGREWGKKDMKKLTRGTAMQFAGTTADDMRRNDLKFWAVEVFNKDGTINEDLQPLKHWDNDKGMFQTVLARQTMPTSHFRRMISIKQASEAHVRQATGLMYSNIDKELALLVQPIFQTGTQQDHSKQLYEVAVARLETTGAYAELREAERSGAHDNEIVAKNERYHKYRAHQQELENELNKIGDKTFDFDGKKYTGYDLVHLIEKANNTIGEWFYDNRIKLNDDFLNANIVISTGGVIDMNKSFQDLIRLNSKSNITFDDLRRAPFEGTQLAEWRGALEEQIQNKVGTHARPTLEAVKNLEYGRGKIIGDTFPEIKEIGRMDQQKFLFTLYRLKRDLPVTGKGLGTELALNAYDDMLSGKRFNPSLREIGDMMRYFGERIRARDFRYKHLGQRKYSAYNEDIAFSNGDVTPYFHLYKQLENAAPFLSVGKKEGYFPHMGHKGKDVETYFAKEMEKILRDAGVTTKEQLEDVKDAAVKERTLKRLDGLDRARKRLEGEEKNPDGLMTEASARGFLDPEYSKSLKHLQELGGKSKPGNLMDRKFDIPGYEVSPDVWKYYGEKLENAIFNNMAAFQMKRIIFNFEKTRPMGDQNEAWAFMMRAYGRDTMGLNSIFPLEAMSDPRLQLQSFPYRWVSDQAVFNFANKHRKWAEKIFGKDFTPEMVGDKLRDWKSAEARFETASLLFSIRNFTTNVLQGSIADAAYVGARHYFNTYKLSTWQRINPEWKSMDDVRRWILDTGAIESYIVDDGTIVSRRYGVQWAKFRDALIGKLKRDPAYADEKIMELSKEYGVYNAFVDGSASLVKKGERITRERAFLGSYLAAKASMEPIRLKWDNPWLIQQAIKGMQASQFLYNQSSRGAFARTNIGGVLTRYKHWGWASVKSRREIYDEAAARGFRPGSHEFERLKRRMLTDMFLVGLAALLPYSIFGTSLPPPLSYFQNTAMWLFGDSKDKKNAFNASRNGIPYPLAPLNELMPPVARFGKGIYDLPESFKLLFGGELDRLGELQSYSLFPWGRMSKDIYHAYSHPERAVDILMGLPVNELARIKKDLK